MSTLNLDILLSENKNFKIVKVKFATTETLYTYKTLLDIKVDDTVVVQARDALGVAVVKEVLSYAEYFSNKGGYALKWVVQKVDLTNLNKMMSIELDLKKAEQEINLRNIKEEMCKDATVKALLSKCQTLLIAE